MLSRLAFEHAASAQLVLNPGEDKVLAINACARDLLQLQTLPRLRASLIFAPSWPQFLVFTEAALETGSAWSDQIIVSVGNTPLRLEAKAKSTCNERGERSLYISLENIEERLRRSDHAEALREFRSGIGHWNQVSRVFREFERGNQLLLDAAGEGIYGVDANGMTTFVNPAAEKILGYTAEELHGKNMHSTIHHSHGDGSHFPAKECLIFEAFRDGVVHEVADDVFWAKNGQPIAVEYTSTPIKDNGFIVGAVVVFRDVSQKKSDQERLLAALSEVERLKNRLEAENAYLLEEINSEFNHHRIVGKSAAIGNIIQQINLVGPTDATVLIHGESGTRKELIARAIHESSERSSRSLIRVNCAAIPADLFESEFFGHAKGAFTGALADRAGRFELADGGTLFLDEVGELPLALQGKLLRVLQEQQFERVGETRLRDVDVRIIAATNRDLTQEIQAGRFREDLYFRLNVFPIHSVPLRKRREDIPLLTQFFIEKACEKANKPMLKIPLGELDKLLAYHWPGNIRELENVIERQVILAKGGAIKFDGLTNQDLPQAEQGTLPQGIITYHQLKALEKANIIAVLEACNGKIFGEDGAASRLDINPTTLASKIKKYRIDARAFKASADERVVFG